jgi:hypothetical protein
MNDDWNMHEPSYGYWMNYPDNDLEGVRNTMNNEQTGQDTSQSGWDLKQIPCKRKARIYTATATSSVI